MEGTHASGRVALHFFTISGVYAARRCVQSTLKNAMSTRRYSWDRDENRDAEDDVFDKFGIPPELAAKMRVPVRTFTHNESNIEIRVRLNATSSADVAIRAAVQGEPCTVTAATLWYFRERIGLELMWHLSIPVDLLECLKPLDAYGHHSLFHTVNFSEVVTSVMVVAPQVPRVAALKRRRVTLSRDWFYRSGLRKLDLSKVPSDSWELTIGPSAFAYCESLAHVNLGSAVVRIAAGAFAATAIQRIRIPKSVRVIENNAFASTALEGGGCTFFAGARVSYASAYAAQRQEMTASSDENTVVVASDAFDDTDQVDANVVSWGDAAAHAVRTAVDHVRDMWR